MNNQQSTINNQQSSFSIVTPSFNQLDWLRLCVASVRDQVEEKAEKLKSQNPDTNCSPGVADSPVGKNSLGNANLSVSASRDFSISVEHIIQDAGTPGIEEFAKETGADFYRDGVRIADYSLPIAHSENQQSAINNMQSRYRLAIYCERDSGMYDAVNRGFRRANGAVFAYLNCDEQYLPGTLNKIAALFDASPSTDVFFCDAIVVDSEGGYVCDRKVMVPSRLHTLVSGNLSIFTSSTFSRASVFKERNLYFDVMFRNVGDADWALRLIAAPVSLRTTRLRASVFTDTGDNLNMQPGGLHEKEQLRERAPAWAKAFSAVIVAFYRLRRLFAGIYALKPHSYEIYTRKSPAARTRFEASDPSFIWPGR